MGLAPPLRPPKMRRPRGSGATAAAVPVPIGGINTVDAGSAMPATDAVYAYNMIAGEFGLRSRLGYREWCTGLTGSANASVRSILPFAGSFSNGSTDKLFACTDTGIWDVSASSQAPVQVVTFPVVSPDSGWGVSLVCPTAAGHFLLYFDEENGYYVYSEATTTWVKPVLAASTKWTPATAYALNAAALNNGVTYKCTTAGTSAGPANWLPATAYALGAVTINGGTYYKATTAGTSNVAPATGPSGGGVGIPDGTVVWSVTSAPNTGPVGQGSGIADGGAVWAYTPSIANVDPAQLSFGMVHQSRVWMVQKNTTLGWYLDFNAIYGAAVSFDFGIKFRAGGTLVGLYNWTVDGGGGLQNSLVGISGAGDVAIYQGTDPASSLTFGLKGVWYVGGVPFGRRIATDYGGDLLILSQLGIVSLSKLIIGNTILDKSQYATAKIANLFNVLATTYKTLRAWSLRIHPNDNALLVTVPTADGQPTVQLAMSLATRGWFKYRDLPIVSTEAWGGQLYFGTADGRVCVNTDYVDNVLLANPNAFTPVQYSVLTSFQNLGNGRQKRVQVIRPTIISQGALIQPQATAKFRYDISEPPPPTGTAGAGKGTWDTALWDTDIWAGEYVAQQQAVGAAGMGPEVAIAIRGVATSRTSLVGIDVVFDQGGFL